VDWFYRHLKGKTDYDNLPPISPPYWGKYVRHDNNRDGVQRKLALTRATQDAFLRWHPAVVHDLHESIPLLSHLDGTGPYNVNLDPHHPQPSGTPSPFHEVATLTGFGMPGVWTYGFGEGWAHIYATRWPSTTTPLAAATRPSATAPRRPWTATWTLDEEKLHGQAGRRRATGIGPRRRPREVQLVAARQHELHGDGRAGGAAVHAPPTARTCCGTSGAAAATRSRRGETEKPYAVVIPEKQDDALRVAGMINLLRAHGIEVSRAREAFKVKEGDYPAGTYVVRMDQPYRGYALDLLLPQKYPADKAPYEAYDDVAWSLPVSFGVDTRVVEDEAVRRVPVDAVSEPVVPRGRVAGDGPVFLVRDAGQEALLQARVRLARFTVEAAEKAFSAGGVSYPAGSWVLPAQAGLKSALDAVAADLGLEVASAARRPTWPGTRSTCRGWPSCRPGPTRSRPGGVRMIFDDEKVPYALIMDEDVKKGGLAERFDIILFPNTERSLKAIATGIDPKHRPLAFTKTAGVPEPRHADLVAGHHGRAHLARPGQPRGVRAAGRAPRHAGRRVHGSPRRRAGTRRVPRHAQEQRVRAG
jgi:hypothetical protein